jgi:hypothetical protein
MTARLQCEEKHLLIENSLISISISVAVAVITRMYYSNGSEFI